MSDSWHSYPSTFQLGHRALAELFSDPVLVEEKIDGSQFSFGVFVLPPDARRATMSVESLQPGYEGIEVSLLCRSKGQQLNLIAPEKMFLPAIDTARRLAPILTPGWTYRGEFLAKPKHNALAYDRVPNGHVILFDVNPDHEAYIAWDDKAREAERLGLEIAPRLYYGMVSDVQMFRALLDTVSVLGGQKVEGVVVKNYARFGPDKKVLIGKYVSESFKEVHAAEWKAANPSTGDVIQNLINQYRTPARWAKARQHMAEAGKLEQSPRDIGLLMKEVPEDIARECEEEIKEKLWAWAWPKMRRGVCAGLPEWVKERLLEEQFRQDVAGADRA